MKQSNTAATEPFVWQMQKQIGLHLGVTYTNLAALEKKASLELDYERDLCAQSGRARLLQLYSYCCT